MPVQVFQGTIVSRVWGREHGLEESGQTFRSLEELFELCLKVDDPNVVDRVVVEGNDEYGKPRTLILAFQSISGLED